MAPHLDDDGPQGNRRRRPAERPGTDAAFMIVDARGTVVRETGWEQTLGRPAPERIAPGGDGHDWLLACLVEAIEEAGITGGLARRTAHLADPPRLIDISAASLAVGGGGANTAIIVQPRGRSAGSGGPGSEGNAIRKLEHDLRSPMTSISGAAEMLDSTRLGGMNDQQRKCLGVIQRGVDSMLELLEAAAGPYRQAKALRNEPLAPPDADGEAGKAR
ncbi:MAG TPA: histidine kinase dimerization/phospho-acceptor domain-containing protein [Candidatus Polarisedimenticolia bacterium]|nr:histidine kinase dimerization/phospho-acceptor domain-containing protein [Candidatus Polarisedimenticolia bacterium]